jgi:hypothetical protein
MEGIGDTMPTPGSKSPSVEIEDPLHHGPGRFRLRRSAEGRVVGERRACMTGALHFSARRGIGGDTQINGRIPHCGGSFGV